METQELRVEHKLTRLVVTELRQVSQLNAWKSVGAILLDWAWIAICLAVATLSHHPAVWVLSACLIAGRQHALLILMHDGAHFRIHPSRAWNDIISNWLLAYPFFASTEGYRNNHLSHHSYLNTDDDPDWVRKLANADWDLPKTKLMVLGILLRDFFGGGVIDQINALRDIRARGLKTGGQNKKSPARLIFYVSIATLLTMTHTWVPFILLWLVPIFMILPVLLRLRSIAEHFALPGETAYNSSRNYAGPWWERMFFTPHNVGFHLDHHLFPSVPFYNLPKLNQMLNQHPEYRDVAHRNPSLFPPFGKSVLNDITTSSKNSVLNQKRRAQSPAAIPGPKETPVIGSTYKFVKNPLAFLVNLRQQFGDVSRFKLNFRNYYLLTNPEDIQNFFIRDYAKFDKSNQSTTMMRLRRLIGNGLLTCPFADHKQQRRMAQPAFTASSLEAYGNKIPEILNNHFQSWNGPRVDLTSEMDHLILKISTSVLFGDDTGVEAPELEREMTRFQRALLSPIGSIFTSLIPGSMPSSNSRPQYFRSITERMIHRGLASGFSGENFLSVMLRSAAPDGTLSKEVINNLTSQIVNMIVASAETVSSSLNWIWYLLSQNEGIQVKVQDEIDRVFEGQAPTHEKLSELHYTEAIIKESLRLFPPVWVISRDVNTDYAIGRHIIPKGSLVMVSPFATHRDPRFFEQPLEFRPDRWLVSDTEKRPEFSYFPFGGGPRMCIGYGFAMMEMKLIIATMAQKWRLGLEPGQKVELHPLITVRPKKHIHINIQPRSRTVFREPLLSAETRHE